MTDKTLQKRNAAKKALAYVKGHDIIGVGTGSTTAYFIEGLAEYRGRLEGAVASSVDTKQRLKAVGIPVLELNSVNKISLYIDGADEFNNHGYLIKGGGGALAREKIIASASEQFICIVGKDKEAVVLGHFPVAIEVLPMARSFVARECLKRGGDPVYRQGFQTDNGNVILDVYNFDISSPSALETELNNIPGVVCNGIFAHRKADIILVGREDGVTTLTI